MSRKVSVLQYKKVLEIDCTTMWIYLTFLWLQISYNVYFISITFLKNLQRKKKEKEKKRKRKHTAIYAYI